MVNLTSFLMIYTFIKLSLIIKEIEANEISTLKSLWCILKTEGVGNIRNPCRTNIVHDCV